MNESLWGTIAREAAEESVLWADAMRPATEREEIAVFSPLGRDGFGLAIESIYEGYLLHYGRPRLFSPAEPFGAFLHEAHHGMKKDAPSGTALQLKRTMEQAGFARPIDVSATRAGFIPGTHTIGFDGPSESITLSHTARDRGAFARGALTAARWVKGRQGWFTMHDVLGIRRPDL